MEGLLRELQPLAEKTVYTYEYADRSRKASTDFTVVASGPLDPFSRFRECSELHCRRAAADEFAKTLGVYADSILLMDRVSHRVSETDRWSDLETLEFMCDVDILQRLEPLV